MKKSTKVGEIFLKNSLKKEMSRKYNWELEE
jgi:hypothetical protein